MQIHTLQLVCLIFTEKNIFKKPGFTWILWWTSGDVTSWTTPGAWLQENTEPTERFWPWHPKKMISDSQKITIPSTPTAAASTLQYFHLHRGFKACNDVNYVKKKKNIGYEYDSYLPNWGKFSSINVRRGYCLNLISSSSLSVTDQVLIYRHTQACETTPLKTLHSFITAIRY